MRFALGVILLVIGAAAPIVLHDAYWDAFGGFNKVKAGLIMTGSFLLLVMGGYLMGHEIMNY